MSGGRACQCKPPDRSTWRVTTRNGNHSKFNGRRFTSSAYSEIQCTACRSIWRSKGKFVNDLPNAPARWWEQ